MIDEAIIIKQILAGDDEKYKVLLDRYQPGLIRHCAAMVYDNDTANDIAQEACIKGYFQLKHYQENYYYRGDSLFRKHVTRITKITKKVNQRLK